MGRRDARIFSTLPEAVAATNPQSKPQAPSPKSQAPSSKIPGQGTSRDFALCIGRSISILVCRLRCISAKFRPLSLHPCTRRGLHRFLCSVYNFSTFSGDQIMSTAARYDGRQATTALCFKDTRYKLTGHRYRQRPLRPFTCQPATSRYA